MRDAPYSSARVITISDPTPDVLSVPNYVRGRDHWQSAHRWHLHYPKGRAEPDDWQLVFTGSELQLTAGETHLLALIKGVEDLSAGRGDYAISGDAAGDHECLWFWWWVGAA